MPRSCCNSVRMQDLSACPGHLMQGSAWAMRHLQNDVSSQCGWVGSRERAGLPLLFGIGCSEAEVRKDPAKFARVKELLLLQQVIRDARNSFKQKQVSSQHILLAIFICIDASLRTVSMRGLGLQHLLSV
eukprot:1157198-Pelagomonas_calceolata.AAC.11